METIRFPCIVPEFHRINLLIHPIADRGYAQVQTASVAPPAGMSVYGAIKASFHGMVRALIRDVGGTGVRINILSPGTVDTPSLRRALGKAGGAEQADATVKSIAERSPLGRLGQASEIGRAAVFLASEAASYVNGVELFVDGGDERLSSRAADTDWADLELPLTNYRLRTTRVVSCESCRDRQF
jgi:NAD(P)-dependent dehydrogenase (short-subunit alcohol dehydrogenase family)